MLLLNFFLCCLFPIGTIEPSLQVQPKDYIQYHKQIIEIETQIASEQYQAVLQAYEELFSNFEFVFLRDYQIAAQVALFLDQKQKAKQFLLKGIEAGWSLKSIRKNKFLNDFRKQKDWQDIKKEYPSLRMKYKSGINQELRKRVRKMYRRDQRMALKVFLRINEKSRIQYAEQKFAPHSEKQVIEFLKILDQHGYPGEMLIGNNFWMSTILSHHNSISQSYTERDTFYTFIKPQLSQSLSNGQISAFEYVLIDEWFRASINKKSMPTYGILKTAIKEDLKPINELRKSAFLRSIEVHNQLIEIEEKTGMHFYLEGHPWSDQRIQIKS